MTILEALRAPKAPLDAPRLRLELFALGIACFLASLTLTSSMLIALGPFRGSLTSTIDSVRRVAEIEVSIMRGLFAVAAVLSITVAWKWQEITGSRFVRRILAYPGGINLEPADDRLLNRSFVILAAVFALALFYVALAGRFLDVPTLVSIHQEDGLIEYGSAVVLMACGVLAALTSLRCSLPNQRWMLRLFALGFFFMTAEEISWGQRIFGMETLEVFKGRNVQDENNLHNLLGYAADHVFIAAILVYGCIMPLLARGSLFFRRLFEWMGLPIASLGLAAGFLAVSLVHNWTLYRVFEPLPALRMAELREGLTAVALFLLVWETRARIRARRLGAA